MMVTRTIDFSQGLTTEQEKMLKELETAPAVPDEDCPELTDEQIIKYAAIAREKRRERQTKQTVSIRLSPQALQKAQSLGKGYTSVLSRILEAALEDNELIKHYL
ncbi:MAG: BrnA antitoxin family protein [Oscillospiraceae bacterium]|nr:BrnA antitoxin family protein [Oscillospiraceae bacterium]